jgi:DNA (cytosine-5)-methyltransferase 1
MVPTSANQEMDEYIFDSDENIFSNDVPVRILKNWAMYTADSRLISLELIPMKLGADNDVVVFGSGFMREDNDICYSTLESVCVSF